MNRDHSVVWSAAAVLLLAVVLALTLRSSPDSALAAQATSWWCVSCGATGSADLFQNLLLLLPLGFALGRLALPYQKAIVFLVLLPIGIEIAQALWIAGRDATLGDVLANGSGGLLGFWFGMRARLPEYGARHGWRSAALVFGLFVAQLLATSSLVRPSIRGATPWQLRLAPAVNGRPVYRGELMTLDRNGRAILTASDAERQGGMDRHLVWLVRFTWQATAPDQLTPVLRLDDARHWPIFALDLRDEKIGVEVRTMAGALRFRDPTWLAPVPADIAERNTVTVRYTAAPGSVALSTTTGSTTLTTLFPLGAQHGWSLINPFTPTHGDPTAWHRWTLAWLAGWGLLLGVSASLARRRWSWGLASLVALWAATMRSGTPIDAAEGAALVAGWLLGVWSTAVLQARRRPAADARTRSLRRSAPAHRET